MVRSLLAAVAILSATVVQADDQHIDIQGFHLGMNVNDWAQHSARDFKPPFRTPLNKSAWDKPVLSIGDVPVKNRVQNHGTKGLLWTSTIDVFWFDFEPSSFESVKAAITSQYPETSCDANRCTLIRGNDRLTLTPGELLVEPIT